MTDLNTPKHENYVAQATGPNGEERFELVKALGAQDAIDQLRRRGFTNIQLETDDSIRTFPGGGGADAPNLIVRDLIRMRGLSNTGMWFFVLWISYRTFIWPVGAVLVGLAARRLAGAPMGWVDALLGVLALSPACIAAAAMMRSAFVCFRKIQQHYVMGRYDQVLALIPEFERVMRRRPSPEFVAVAATEWRAKSLAKQGHLTEALAEVEQLTQLPGIKPLLHCCIRAEVFIAASKPEEALPCFDTATDTEPTNPLGWLGKCDVLAIYLDRPREARECFEHLRSLPLSPQTRELVLCIEGAVLLAEGKHADARVVLEECLPRIQRKAKTMPIAVGLESILKAQLAIACAKAGDHSLALSYFESAQPYLELHKLDFLLARCRREIISIEPSAGSRGRP